MAGIFQKKGCMIMFLLFFCPFVLSGCGSAAIAYGAGDLIYKGISILPKMGTTSYSYNESIPIDLNNKTLTAEGIRPEFMSKAEEILPSLNTECDKAASENNTYYVASKGYNAEGYSVCIFLVCKENKRTLYVNQKNIDNGEEKEYSRDINSP